MKDLFHLDSIAKEKTPFSNSYISRTKWLKYLNWVKLGHILGKLNFRPPPPGWWKVQKVLGFIGLKNKWLFFKFQMSRFSRVHLTTSHPISFGSHAAYIGLPQVCQRDFFIFIVYLPLVWFDHIQFNGLPQVCQRDWSVMCVLWIPSMFMYTYYLEHGAPFFSSSKGE